MNAEKRRREAVSRILFPPSSAFAPLARRYGGLWRMTTIPLAPPSLTGSSNLPGGIGRAVLIAPPYLALLRAGFCLPPMLPPARCALTAPFHPYPPPPSPLRSELRRGRPVTELASPKPARSKRRGRRRAVYFLCHFPSGHPDRALPGALPCGVRTFLPVAAFPSTRTSRDNRGAAIAWLPAANCQRPRQPARVTPYPSVSWLIL